MLCLHPPIISCCLLSNCISIDQIIVQFYILKIHLMETLQTFWRLNNVVFLGCIFFKTSIETLFLHYESCD